MKWISVNERMPKHFEAVLVDGGIAYWSKQDLAWYTLTGAEWPGRIIQWEVTHWMPLPELSSCNMYCVELQELTIQ